MSLIETPSACAFSLIDIDLELRRIFRAVRTHANQQIGMLSNHTKQLVTRLS